MCFLTPVSSPTSSSSTCHLPLLPSGAQSLLRTAFHHLPKPPSSSSPTPTAAILSLQLVTWHCYFLFTVQSPEGASVFIFVCGVSAAS